MEKVKDLCNSSIFSEVVSPHLIWIPVPNREFCILSYFNGSNFLFEKHLARGPDRHRSERRSNIHGLVPLKRITTVDTNAGCRVIESQRYDHRKPAEPLYTEY